MTDKPKVWTLEESTAHRPLELDLPGEQATTPHGEQATTPHEEAGVPSDEDIRLDRIIAGHTIDCDVDPFVPDGWAVEEHRRGGHWQFDPRKIELYLSKRQQKGWSDSIDGLRLYEVLKTKDVLNANVLDYLLRRHPLLIPKEWRGKAICFWGTIYCHRRWSFRCVRLLHWTGRSDSGWGWDHLWKLSRFPHTAPAALRKS